jgi:hypothetical protein
LHCTGLSWPSLTTAISCQGQHKNALNPHQVWNSWRWLKILSCGKTTWWSHLPLEFFRYSRVSASKNLGPLNIFSESLQCFIFFPSSFKWRSVADPEQKALCQHAPSSKECPGFLLLAPFCLICILSSLDDQV